MNKIDIPLPNGFHIVAEYSEDVEYPYELYVGLENADGAWVQDLAIIRNEYRYEEDGIVWEDDKINVLVWSEEDRYEPSYDFTVGIYHDVERIN